MNFIGELKDHKVALSIIDKWHKQNIIGQLQNRGEVYILFIENKEDYIQALEIYRVTLRLPPPPQAAPAEWQKIKKLPLGQVTMLLLGLCVGIYLIARFSGNRDWWQWLFISTHKDKALSEIRGGELWRIWTPIFLHFNFIHLLFNMLWLKDLGSVIEFRRGTIFFILFILIIGGLSNFGQFFVHGPLFGGMSGVVYGFLGYLWMNKKFSPAEEFSLPKADVTLMVGWFVLCLTGIIGPIANAAHGVGLGLGMLWGMGQGMFDAKVFPVKKVLIYLLVAIIVGPGTMAFEAYR